MALIIFIVILMSGVTIWTFSWKGTGRIWSYRKVNGMALKHIRGLHGTNRSVDNSRKRGCKEILWRALRDFGLD